VPNAPAATGIHSVHWKKPVLCVFEQGQAEVAQREQEDLYLRR
jgi:hypothetical protein